jgi:hypothetical protein
LSYLIKNGSERVVTSAREHLYDLRSLENFTYTVLVHPTLYNQLLAHGQWFSPGTPASSTTKTGRHDIQNVAEILLKVALKHQKSNKKNFIQETES